MSAFKTFSESALAILAFSLGEMRTDMILRQYIFMGPIYLLLLTFILIFVFQNMFFVILSYNYESVREGRNQLDRGLNVTAFLRNGYLNLRKAMHWPVDTQGPEDDLERRLVRCGLVGVH